MSLRRALLAPLLPLAIGLAACGGAGTPAGPSSPSSPSAKVAPAAGGALTVRGTDLRLGGAVADDGKGTRRLAGPSRPDPASLTDRGRRRDGVGAGATCADADLMPSAQNMDRVVASTLCLLNGERADAGLGPLSPDDDLAQSAIGHSRDMVANSYFAHDTPSGQSATDRIRASGYIPSDKAWTVGENLAWGTGDLATPGNIVKAWMNSPGHRANILRPVFNQIGFGVVAGNPQGKDGQGATYTTTFGSLGGSTAAAANAGSASQSAPVASRSTQVKATRSRSARRRAKAARRRAHARATRAKAARVRARAASRRG